MPSVPPDLRNRVRHRAGKRCEYCGLQQDTHPFVLFQVEHIVARQHGGATSDENLAWACAHCNLRKGPNLSGIDPISDRLTPLYNPRRQRWSDHFEFAGPLIVGRTDVGRTTVRVLAMNAPRRVEMRSLANPPT